MKKRIIGYRVKIDNLLSDYKHNKLNKSDMAFWKDVLEEHLTQIAFFQHERLIHLIVTVLFALMTIISLAIYIIAEFVPILGLMVLLLVLLIPYIGHYYTLENETQKMYAQYDEILDIIRNL